ncbi:phage tailspike protein [Atlantibacter hermannii]|uniref:phage tailspike protein n=1 Tax=Atlantibacter hermannii TaxID=565 RepID=UPI00254ED2D7|nr:phage tailspike protein [Atlantibacter hermannii]
MSDITANIVVSMPSQLFTLARSFKAASNGKIFIGLPDTDPTIPENQIQVYLENEDGSHVPVSQPLRINAGGYPVYNGQVAKFVTTQAHSMSVFDSYNVHQFYFGNLIKYDSDNLLKILQQEGSGALVNDSNVFIKQPLAKAIQRSQHEKNAEFISVRDFGAIGDGTLHSLAEKFSSLSLAQVVYPYATSLSQSIDSLSIQSALDTGKNIYLTDGVFICDIELEIKTNGQRIVGAGRGYGYNANTERYSPDGQVAQYSSAVFNWTHVSTLLFKGTGTKRVRTRVNYRASAADPQDAPMSVGLNVQAEGTQLENFCVFLDITPPAGGPDGELTDSIDNLGADWDVGIFVGCRGNTKLKDVASIGYHRKANIWLDVTQGLNLPRFNSYRGGSYPQGPVENGADGCTLDGVFTSGGLWGVNVQGAKPKSGESTYTTQYYDDLLGAAVDDTRGSWGFSDFLMVNCQIFGANHHTRRRLVDMKASPNAINDWDVGGAFSIDGLTSNASNAIHGHRYIDCRYQSWAPFCVRIDRSARDAFFGAMIENPASFVKSRDGSDIVFGVATSFYGLCATFNHQFLFLSESQAPYTSTYTNIKFGDGMLFNSSLVNRYSKIPFGEMRVISESQMSVATGRVLLGYPGNESDVAIQRTTTGSATIRSSNALNFSNGTDNLFTVSSLGTVQSKQSVACLTDNTGACGLPSSRWTTVYAASGTINTSDERVKEDIECIPDVVLKAWGKVSFMQFRFTDAIDKKGAGAARIHFGLVAQRVKEAFESEGLDPFSYGILCYDEWEDEYTPVMSTRFVANQSGEMIEEEFDTGERKLVTPAGNRYGVRYEEALSLECAYLRWRLDKSTN